MASMPRLIRQTINFFPPSSNHPTSCLIEDALYGGPIVIVEPSIISLLLTPTMLRLKSIGQHGITALLKTPPVADTLVTRYEHSVGAMLLLKKLRPDDIEQQVAALLHDVSHTVLSHVTDFAFGYVVHEVDREAFLRETEIPGLLKEFDLDADAIIGDVDKPGRFPLLEQDSPLLCADRLDYGLRDMLAFGVVDGEQARSIVNQLTVGHNEHIVCTSIQQASVLARGYMLCDALTWSCPTHSSLYQLAGNAIRHAVEVGELSHSDLWKGSDGEFWRCMRSSSNAEVRRQTGLVRGQTSFERVSRREDIGEDGLELQLKVRTLDPEVIVDGRIARLMDLDRKYKKEREDYIESKREKRFMRVIPPSEKATDEWDDPLSFHSNSVISNITADGRPRE